MSENVEKKEFVVIYDNLTFSDKVGLIERGLKRRLENLPNFKKIREEEIEKILSMKTQIEERIEKFKDDELIVNGLKANLEEFEKTYVKIANDHKTDIEEAEKTIPQVETLLRHINNIRFFEEDTELLECVFDIFLSNVIRDWAVFEEMEKERDEETN